jgi:cytochrome c oxidase assembly protein subunit 15
MVASGLADRTAVSQYRLATHLVLACLILAVTLWTAQGLLARPQLQTPARIRWVSLVIVALVLVQLYVGGLLAGMRGGLVYNTWPLMNASLVPSASELFALHPAWRNLFENVATVQFDHRMIAYALWFMVVCHVIDIAASGPRAVLYSAGALAVGISLQAVLGVVTLLHGAPLALALTHQGLAIVVLSVAVTHAQRVNGKVLDARLANPKSGGC